MCLSMLPTQGHLLTCHYLDVNADSESFYEACDPSRENLCLFGKLNAGRLLHI